MWGCCSACSRGGVEGRASGCHSHPTHPRNMERLQTFLEVSGLQPLTHMRCCCVRTFIYLSVPGICDAQHTTRRRPAAGYGDSSAVGCPRACLRLTQVVPVSGWDGATTPKDCGQSAGAQMRGSVDPNVEQ